MTEYICKCGRKVGKSTKADNTGNRETVGCDGCPYLMPYGSYEFDELAKKYRIRADGYECRMSPRLEYATEIIGRVDDKCTMHIDSLDFDFLGRVGAWIKAHYPAGEISGDFNPDLMRACQYVSDGRYRMSISCAQNKAGMAAKNELMRAFFDRESKRRLDKTPEEEKQKILGDIDRGKELGKGPDAEAIADQDYEEAHKPVIYKDGKSLTLYRVPVKATADGVYPIQRMLYHTCVYEDVPDYTATASRDSALAALEERARAGGWTYIDIEAKLYGKTDEEAEAAVLSEDIGLTGPTGAAEAAAVTEPTETAAPASGDDLPQPCVKTAPEQCKTCTCVDCGVAVCNGGPQGCRYKQDANGNCAVYDDDIASRAVCGYAPCTAESAAEAPASGDDVCGHCVCPECDDDNCLQAHCDCRDRGAGCIKPDDDCRHDHPELFPEADKQVDARRPTSSAAATAAVVTAAEVPAHADAANTMAEPAAPLSEQMDDAAGSALAASTGSALAAFDYAGLDDKTIKTLHAAELRIKDARKNYLSDMADAVNLAHSALCGTDATQCRNGDGTYGGKAEQTFGAWCEYIGISRKTGERLVQVHALLAGCDPEEQSVLEQAPSTLLYAAAKPSAPAEAVEAVKSGDITTMPEYKALLDQLARKDEAIRAAQEANEKNRVRANQAEDDYDAATQRAETAEQRARSAEQQRDNLIETNQAHLAKIQELEKRPIEVTGYSAEDKARWVDEGRKQASAEAGRKAQLLRQQLDEAQNERSRLQHALAGSNPTAIYTALAEQAADSVERILRDWFGRTAGKPDAYWRPGSEILNHLAERFDNSLAIGQWMDEDLTDDGEEGEP